MIGRGVVIACVLSLGSATLYPCGGPTTLPIDAPLVAPEALLEKLYGLDYYWGPSVPPAGRFLHPLAAAHLSPMETDWLAATGALGHEQAPVTPTDASATVTLAGLRAAALGDDRAAIGLAAQAIVDRVLDLPASLADGSQAAFRRAVEYLELEPILAQQPNEVVRAFLADSAVAGARWPTELREALHIRAMSRQDMARYADSAPRSPRAPSLRYVALQEEMKREIPNGWLDDIRKAATPELWARLHASHDRWLADFPNSPLQDLVRLSRVRLHYLAGDVAAAWRLLLDFYPDRHPARIFAEMRLIGSDPSIADDPRVDVPLRLTLRVPRDRQVWCDQWRATEASPEKAWALAQQEQMLYRLGEESPADSLPECFPSRAEVRSPFWGRARLAVLLKHHREAEAKAQAALLGAGEDVAPVVARFAIREGRWVDAALTPALDSAAVLYLIRVLAPRAAVERLTTEKPRWIREDAALTLAIERAAVGDWAGGAAMLKRVGSGRAERWLRIGTMARDTSRAGRLAMARLLVRDQGRIFYPRDVYWYRSVGGRLAGLEGRLANPEHRPPLSADSVEIIREERERIRTHLFQSTEAYLALRLYGMVLGQSTKTTPGRTTVVAEADRVYRRLIDWSNGTTMFWAKELINGPEARAIRRAGRVQP